MLWEKEKETTESGWCLYLFVLCIKICSWEVRLQKISIFSSSVTSLILVIFFFQTGWKAPLKRHWQKENKEIPCKLLSASLKTFAFRKEIKLLSPALTLEALLNIPGTDRKTQAHVAAAWEIYVQMRRFRLAVQQRIREHSACLQDSVSSLLLKNKQTQKGNTLCSVQLSRTSVNICPSVNINAFYIITTILAYP